MTEHETKLKEIISFTCKDFEKMSEDEQELILKMVDLAGANIKNTLNEIKEKHHTRKRDKFKQKYLTEEVDEIQSDTLTYGISVGREQMLKEILGMDIGKFAKNYIEDALTSLTNKERNNK